MDGRGSFSPSFPRSTRLNHQPNLSEDLLGTLNNERWRTYFQQAQKIQSSLPASSRLPSTAAGPMKNLVDVTGTRLFFWDQEKNAVVLTNIQDAELDRVTILECDIAPLFEVTSIAVSTEGSSVALIGQKGVSILDIGAEDSIPESGRKIARCIAISERFFLNNPKITVVQCEWFPFRESHIVLLSSDNNLRFYRISSPSQPGLVVSLHGSTTKRSLHSFAAFALAQSDSTQQVKAINSPQKGGSTVTVYALKSDGNVWTFDVAVESSRTVASSLCGPLLPNAPFAMDMSQMATSILFIDAALPVLLIASNRQRIISGVLIEKDDIEVDSEVHSSGIIPSKHEFLEIERLELSMASGEAGNVKRPTGSAKLLSSPRFPSCYVYATESQLLGVKLPWLDDLELLVSDKLDISSIRPSSVHTVLCLDPFLETGSVGLIGSRLIETDFGDCSVLSVASHGQVTLQKLIQSSDVHKPATTADQSVTFSPGRDFTRRPKPANEVPFDQYIESVLRRDKSLPSFTYDLLRSGVPEQFSAEELTRIASQYAQQFQEQHVIKQKQAYEEIQNRKARNGLRKAELFGLIDSLERRLGDLDAQFHQYSSQAEEADLDALETHSRITSLQEEFSQFNPVLSDAERQLQENLDIMETHTVVVEEQIDTVAAKMTYRERVTRNQQEASGDATVPRPVKPTNSSTTQLAAGLRHLADLKHRVKELAEKLQPL